MAINMYENGSNEQPALDLLPEGVLVNALRHWGWATPAPHEGTFCAAPLPSVRSRAGATEMLRVAMATIPAGPREAVAALAGSPRSDARCWTTH